MKIIKKKGKWCLEKLLVPMWVLTPVSLLSLVTRPPLSNITATPPICIYPTPINSESLDSGGPIVLNNKNFEENFC